MPESSQNVMCAWCDSWIAHTGDDTLPTSHGICDDCYADQIAALKRLHPEPKTPEPQDATR